MARMSPSTLVTFVQANPKRPRSSAAKRYECYKAARTIGEALQLGALAGDLKNDKEREYLQVSRDELRISRGRDPQDRDEPVSISGAAQSAPSHEWRFPSNKTATAVQSQSVLEDPVQDDACAASARVVLMASPLSSQRLSRRSHMTTPRSLRRPEPTSSVGGSGPHHSPRVDSVEILSSPRPLQKRARPCEALHPAVSLGSVCAVSSGSQSQPRPQGHTPSQPSIAGSSPGSELKIVSGPSKLRQRLRVSSPRGLTPFRYSLQAAKIVPRFNASEVASLVGLHPYGDTIDALIRCWGRHHRCSLRCWEASTGGVVLPERAFARHANASVHDAVRVAVNSGQGALSKEAEAKIIEAVEKSAPPAMRQIIADEAMGRARRARGTNLEATGLAAYEKKYGRKVMQRNAQTFRQDFGDPGGNKTFQLVGKVDGFEQAGPSERWVVEHKRRQRRLFEKVPRYEEVQCQIYMAITDTKGCRWVQTMGPKVDARMLHRCSRRWACIKGRLGATAQLLRRLIAGALSPPPLQLAAIQRASWQALPQWPEDAPSTGRQESEVPVPDSAGSPANAAEIRELANAAQATTHAVASPSNVLLASPVFLAPVVSTAPTLASVASRGIVLGTLAEALFGGGDEEPWPEVAVDRPQGAELQSRLALDASLVCAHEVVEATEDEAAPTLRDSSSDVSSDEGAETVTNIQADHAQPCDAVSQTLLEDSEARHTIAQMPHCSDVKRLWKSLYV